MSWTDRIALRIFGGLFKRRSFISSKSLLRARIYVPVIRWQSRVALYSLSISPLLLSAWIIGIRLLFNYTLIWDPIRGFHSISMVDVLNVLSDIFIAIAIMLVFFLILFSIFLLYPSIKAGERGRRIDANLPHAIGWMSSMASIGVMPYLIIKKLSTADEYFGEVSVEARQVVRDVEILGFDFVSALKNVASTTPSVRLRTFLQGVVTSSLSGGEMGNYFISKAKENMEENRKSFSDFITSLGTISEVYVVGMVAGPLLIIVMFMALAMLKGISISILMMIIYGMIPLGSILFLVFVDVITPPGIKGIK